MAELVRSHVAAGDMAAAEAYLDGVLEADPESLPGRFLRAGLRALRGDAAAAEALYRELTAAAPELPEAHRALARLLAAQGRDAEALAALEAGIAAAPDAADLVVAKAGLLEAAGDVAGAIALYETLYARDSSDEVVANNLASLLTGQGAEPAELERAFALARRLRDSEVPQFRDTYGWILYLRGDPEAALGHLAPAAEALPGNALVQFHRAEAELALGRRAAARAAYARALEAAEAGSPLPQAAAARARLDALDAGAAEPGGPGGALSPG
jgi:tetratricopeptide (TPR) repeat protein